MKNILRPALAAMVVAVAFSLPAAAQAADILLPPPQKTGGLPLFEALERRASATIRDFPAGPVTAQDISTILWAAAGRNRDGAGWTVPLAMGKPPYCKIYLTCREGVFLYDGESHGLTLVSGENRHATIPLQGFAQRSPVNLYVVADGQQLIRLENHFSADFGLVLAGAMSQNIYLASDSVGVGARLIYTIRREEAARALCLDDADIPYFAVVLGKRDERNEGNAATRP